MNKILSFKKKLNAFTLIEMLVALSLFSLAMLLIISMVVINSRILSDRPESADSITGILLTQTIKSILINSFDIKKESGDNFTVYSFDGKKYRFHFTDNKFIVEEMKNGSREFNFKTVKKIYCDAKYVGRRTAFHLVIDAENVSIDKWYLLGYRKEEEKT